MKVKTKKHSFIFKGLVLVMAFALAILCAPVDGFTALAVMSQYTDYTFMTISKAESEEILKTSVTQGDRYKIKNAYIGGDEDFAIGRVAIADPQTGIVLQDNTTGDDVVLTASKVTVKYNGTTFTEVTEEAEEETEIDYTEKVVVYADDDVQNTQNDNYGWFRADNLGTYTITYSYTYKIGDKVYQNSYDFRVESTLADASFDFENNDTSILPSHYDLALAKVEGETGDTYKDLHIPTPTIVDENGEDVDASDVHFVEKLPAEAQGHYVVVSAKGGASNEKVDIEGIGTDQMYIAGSTFASATEGAQDYTIKYAYYLNGQFVRSTTKTVTVHAKADQYYQNYALDIKLSTDFVDNGETGVEKSLPTAIGVAGKDTKKNGTNIAGEQLDTYSLVRVYYKAKLADEWTAISQEDYGTEVVKKVKDEQGVDQDGYLVDVTKFKPLEDGFYTFEWTVVDAYGKTATIKKGTEVYEGPEGKGIVDQQKPTPVIYDAASGNKEDASHLLATKVNPNGVIIYAIDLEDNVSTSEDTDVKLVRTVMQDASTKLTIDSKYAKYNLVFNYRSTSSSDAYSNLLLNNYNLRKQVGTINSDAEMLAWMIKDTSNYRIVVDNANAEEIASIFSYEGGFVTEEQATRIAELNQAYIDATDADKENARIARRDYVKSIFDTTEALNAGFAYVDEDLTFGATTSDAGMGNGQYYIHYIATDAAKNLNDISKSMYVSSFVDNDAPTINFPTTLSGQYLPSATITFDAPSASDGSADSRMVTKTLYRFLDEGKKVIALEDASADLTEVWTALNENQVMENEEYLTTTYSAYHNTSANDGYKDITDTDASSYSIKLSEGTSEAKYLQVFVYAFDDNGNVGVYAQTINILNVEDDAVPTIDVESIADGTIKSYKQNDVIEIPTVYAWDDNVDYMTYDIKVYYGSDREKIQAVTNPTVSVDSAKYSYSVGGATFTAGKAGDYQAVVELKDSKNNTIVTFMNFTVSPVTIASAPSMTKISFSNQTIELDDYYVNLDDKGVANDKIIELPVPKINYEIANSITQDAYDALTSETEKAKYQYVVNGVDVNGAATRYSTGDATKTYYKPTKEEEATIRYDVMVDVYDRNYFEWVDSGYVAGSKPTSYYVYKANTNIKVDVVDENTFKAYTDSESLTITKDAKGNISYSNEVSGIFAGINFENWFTQLKAYRFTSEEWTITVDDNKVNENAVSYDYENYIPQVVKNEDGDVIGGIESEDGYDLVIKAIKGHDASGIDYETSYVELSWKLVNEDGTTSSSSKRWTGLVEDTIYNIKSTSNDKKDGTYTLTYQIVDFKGNKKEFKYEIAVGDNVKPTVNVKDGFIEDSYAVGTQITIDLGKIEASDASGIDRKEIVLKDTDGNDITSELEKVGDVYKITLDKVGSYSLQVTVYDKVGNKTPLETFNFEVTAKDKDNTTTYKTVGTILIVVSVIILAGVIVYFIVSKVKLDKELKK